MHLLIGWQNKKTAGEYGMHLQEYLQENNLHFVWIVELSILMFLPGQ